MSTRHEFNSIKSSGPGDWDVWTTSEDFFSTNMTLLPQRGCFLVSVMTKLFSELKLKLDINVAIWGSRSLVRMINCQLVK